MGISVRPKGSGFEARTRINGEQYSRWGPTEKAARERLETLLWASSPPKQATLSWFMAQHLKAARLRSDGYADQAAWAFSKFPGLASRPVSEITRSDVQQAFLSIPPGLSASSLATVKKHLRAAFEIAIDDGEAVRNPAARVTIPKARGLARNTAPLTAKELLALTEASRGLSCHVHVALCGFLGLRPGEVHLVTFGKGCVEVAGTKTKGSKRTIPLPEIVLAEIVNARMPVAFNRSNLRRSVLVAAKRAKIQREVFPYALRHTCATGLQVVGCPEDGRARILGHAKATITAHYSHADLETWRPFLEAWASAVYSSRGNGCGNSKQNGQT